MPNHWVGESEQIVFQMNWISSLIKEVFPHSSLPPELPKG